MVSDRTRSTPTVECMTAFETEAFPRHVHIETWTAIKYLDDAGAHRETLVDDDINPKANVLIARRAVALSGGAAEVHVATLARSHAPLAEQLAHVFPVVRVFPVGLEDGEVSAVDLPVAIEIPFELAPLGRQVEVDAVEIPCDVVCRHADGHGGACHVALPRYVDEGADRWLNIGLEDSRDIW